MPLVIVINKTLLSKQSEIIIYLVYTLVFNLDSQTYYTQKRLGIVLFGFIPVIKGQVKLKVYYTAIELILAYKCFKPPTYIFLINSISNTRNDFKD